MGVFAGEKSRLSPLSTFSHRSTQPARPRRSRCAPTARTLSVMATWVTAGEDEEDMDLRSAELGWWQSAPGNIEQGRADLFEIERLSSRYGVTSISRTMHWSGATVDKRGFF